MLQERKGLVQCRWSYDTNPSAGLAWDTFRGVGQGLIAFDASPLLVAMQMLHLPHASLQPVTLHRLMILMCMHMILMWL